MTVKKNMAEGSQDVKRQKTGKSSDTPSDLVIAMAIKLSGTGDINIPKHHRSDSDDEPIPPLEHKLSDSEITEDMLPPTLDKKKKKHKKKDSKAKDKVNEEKN